jgi:hypothetical protein
MNDRNPQFDHLPEDLIARLRALDRSQPVIDPRTDRAILARAQTYFAVRGERLASPRRKRWAMTFAAAVVAAAFLVVRPIDLFGPHDPDDIDGSGRVDILDAFALARAQRNDERIDTLATRVVSLTPRSLR